MARPHDQYICQACGAIHRKWQGQCSACGEWSTLAEEAPASVIPKGLDGKKGKKIHFEKLDQDVPPAPRIPTGMAELDRVCGGGLVPASALLIGGDPGIGKSTLLLQAAAKLAKAGRQVAYITGEEACDQIRMRARRLGLNDAPVRLAAATSVRDITTSLEEGPPVAVAIIDSIQTMFLDILESAPGTVGQVRASALELIRYAKKRGIVMIFVGHVTKDGQIAGPRVLEHMVDCVLYFEGERGHQFRILRGVKNRYGATDEIGVFEMTDAGLQEVANPSALFLTYRDRPVSGTAIFAGMEGSRPMLVEIEALVGPAAAGSPRRAVVGWDNNRLAMVLAVLEARCGLSLSANDVYLNVAGGFKVTEPAADLAAAMALVSAASGQPVPSDAVVFGEVALSGELRPVGQTDARLKEAAKLGFTRAFLPQTPQKQQNKPRHTGILLDEWTELFQMVSRFSQDMDR